MAIGRPREFDEEQALNSAMKVFWKRGYEGATLPELTEAMGINRPSLYAAFGNKEELFRKVIQHYVNGPGRHFTTALEKASAREAVETILNGSIEMLTCPENPGGCLLMQGALVCSETSNSIRNELIAARNAMAEAIQIRLESAKKSGELPKAADCGDLANYFAAVLHGLGVLALGGTTRDELRRVALLAMRAWPGA